MVTGTNRVARRQYARLATSAWIVPRRARLRERVGESRVDHDRRTSPAHASKETRGNRTHAAARARAITSGRMRRTCTMTATRTSLEGYMGRGRASEKRTVERLDLYKEVRSRLRDQRSRLPELAPIIACSRHSSAIRTRTGLKHLRNYDVLRLSRTTHSYFGNESIFKR